MSGLLNQVRQQATAQLQKAAALPEDVCFRFDAAQEGSPNGGPCPSGTVGGVQKTVRRTVVSLQHGRFQACETVRHPAADGSHPSHRSARLADVVATGARYGYDLIAEVGVKTYLRGRSLQDLREALANQQPAIDIPASSLWDQQQKFLFYLGCLHAQSSPRLRDYLAEQETVCWLLDGTVEPGTSVFLGIREATSGLFLAGRKIPSEHLDDIRPCLQDAATCYGRPDRVLHDLSRAMSGACDAALPEVPHFVCHYHLARDVGEDLYASPQAALVKRQQQLKLQLRLREQRRGQNDWFRQPRDLPVQLVLSRLLAGVPIEMPCDHSLGREVLLAFHYWILDFRSDGRRCGFPFDPYILYMHRRLVRAGQAMDQLLASAVVARQAPQVLRNFQQQLQQYRADPQIVAAAERYERSAAMFTRLRHALRLSAQCMDYLRQPFELSAGEQQKLQLALAELRCQLQRQSEDPDDADRPLAQVVLRHLDKYWSLLVPDQPPGEGQRWERTTNKLESQWGHLKRGRRQSHGRGTLTRDFQALPEEYLLVSNLENPIYVELVLEGNLDNLPSKLAAASREAGSFDAWRRRRPAHISQIPRRQLRETDFLDHLVSACHDHCDPHHGRVA